MSADVDHLILLIREIYETNVSIQLHEPTFGENDIEAVADVVREGMVSTAGKKVSFFEKQIAHFTGSKFTVSCVNGTAALHLACNHLNVGGTYVFTQPFTFVATTNAIKMAGGEPIFIDISGETLSLCPSSLREYIEENTYMVDGVTKHKNDNKVVSSIVVMHTFGHPAKLLELKKIANQYSLNLIEDAAEGLGSYYMGKHVGTFGALGCISFNGNKIITTGGGGAILMKDKQVYDEIRHLSTTAKRADVPGFFHDRLGFNYRMPNLNAALGSSQIGVLDKILVAKRRLSEIYKQFFSSTEFRFVDEPKNSVSNFWLNAVECENIKARNFLLRSLHEKGINARPAWDLQNTLPMYRDCPVGNQKNAKHMFDRIVCLPSSPPTKFMV